MKIKKFLEKVAEDDRESLINDKDIEFLASIGVDYNKKLEENKKKPEASYYLTAPAVNRKAFLISASCFLIIAIVLVLILYYSLKPAPIAPPIGYLDVNNEKVDSDLNELNSELNLFSLVVDEEEYKISIKKTYDSLSGDSLYYSITFTGLMKSFKLEIVVNSLYEYNKNPYPDDLNEAQISDYTVKYTEISKPASGPFSEISCKGEMQIGEQCIYIVSYNETGIGQSTLVETLKEIISFN